MPDNSTDRLSSKMTKILATLGPASEDPEQLARLIREGVSAFRLNFSHGTFDDFARMLEAVREAARRTDEPVGVLGDLCGPKIRLGPVDDQHPDGGVMLEAGDRVDLVDDPTARGRDASDGVARFHTNTPRVLDEIDRGERLLLDDGAVRMLVIEKRERPAPRGATLICSVTIGGPVRSAKGLNMPDSELQLPALTEYDWRCARWAIEHELDLLALSFVRRPEDIVELRSFLRQHKARIPIVAKIEKPQAVERIGPIADACDGIMVARGDLGVEMDLAMVPVVQKRVIAAAHDHGKMVIVATQMLQSMMDAPHPTRAEASDVANAIFDGADAVMLSGETAVGRFPVQAVHTMTHIAEAAEAHRELGTPAMRSAPARLRETRYRTAALAHGVATVLEDLDTKLVLCWSERGGTALYLSQNRLAKPIVAASSHVSTVRRANLLFGVRPLHLPQPQDASHFIETAQTLLLQRQWVETGDAIVVVYGEPLGTAGVTNIIRIHHIGDVCRVPG